MNRIATLAFLSLIMSTLVFADESNAEGQNADGSVAKADLIVPVWTAQPPTWTPPKDAEVDTTGDNGNRVADRRVIRLGNVSTPELHVYRPTKNDTGTVVVVCPGGGYSILAWDLEGTEIAQWLQNIGVTAVVLKYRVPTREEAEPWLAPVQDIQRSIGMVRSGAVEGVKASRVGVLGFSAGGNAATRASLATKRYYKEADAADQTNFTPDFAVLIYPAWLVKDENPNQLIDDLQVKADSPPMFFAHAANDPINPMSSVTLFSELKKNGINGSLHIFNSGGHGFGSRAAGSPTDAWPALCKTWMDNQGWLEK